MRTADITARLSAARLRLPVQLTGLAVMLTAASACTWAETEPDLVRCTDPRPEVCTMDYTPVCALRAEDGSEHWKTYANACTACSDATVKAYREKACATDDP